MALAAFFCAVVFLMTGSSGGGSMTADEKRLSQVLSSIEGAGKVEVAVFYTQTAGSFSGDGAKTPVGAVVVAQGADRMEVRLNLIRAVRTLLKLEENAVDVFVMEDKR